MDEVEEFLEHHGILGMHWGIRNQDPLKSRHKGAQKPSAQGGTLTKSQELNLKYGPNSNKPGFRLTPKEKDALIIGGAALGVAGLVIGQRYIGKNLLGVGAVKDILNEGPSVAGAAEQALKDEVISFGKNAKPEEISLGFMHHLNQGVSLPAGSIIQRFSTEVETTIKPEGFYAAFKKADVKSYVANLPKFWPQWGLDAKAGHLTQIKANVPINAPSGKETLELFKQHIINHNLMGGTQHGIIYNKLSEKDKIAYLDGFAKGNFAVFSNSWVNLELNKNKEFFDLVKSKGYNALVDFNDSGGLAESPLRLLNGTDFTISGHIPVSESDIKNARDALESVAHNEGGDMSYPTPQDILDHSGVKGMHWGIRNKRKVPPSVDARRALELKKKPIHALTNKQLKTLNERTNLERNYQKNKQAKIENGKKKAELILAVAGVSGGIPAAVKLFQSTAGKKAMAAGEKFLVNQVKIKW